MFAGDDGAVLVLQRLPQWTAINPMFRSTINIGEPNTAARSRRNANQIRSGPVVPPFANLAWVSRRPQMTARIRNWLIVRVSEFWCDRHLIRDRTWKHRNAAGAISQRRVHQVSSFLVCLGCCANRALEIPDPFNLRPTAPNLAPAAPGGILDLVWSARRRYFVHRYPHIWLTPLSTARLSSKAGPHTGPAFLLFIR